MYLTVTNSGSINGGVMPTTEDGGPPYWIPYFAVASCDDAAAKVGELGGRVLAGPMEVPAGRIAAFADPQGATFAVFEGEADDQPKTGPARDVVPCIRLDDAVYRKSKKYTKRGIMTDSNGAGRTEVATLGGGCFWCTEAIYLDVRGVKAVESGYSGGHVPTPTYRQV